MRILAEILFWIGRLEHVVLAVFLFHSIAVLRWRRDTFRLWLAVGWFAFFIALSIVLWPGVLSRATDGVGYVEAHLYGGIWHTDEALSTILARWQNLWLPIYVPWLGVWLVGLVSIPALSVLKQRFITKSD